MKETSEFRAINDIETRMIVKSLAEITPKVINIKTEFQLFISLSKSGYEYPNIFLIPKELSKCIVEHRHQNKIHFAGIYFGFIKKGKFFISLEGIEHLLKLDFFSDNQMVIVSNQAEKSVLYGNNILKKMVSRISPNVKKNDIVLIMNQSNELISIAKMHIDYSGIQELPGNDEFAMNIVDKGIYLRKKQ